MRLYAWHQTGYRGNASAKGVDVRAVGMPLEWTTCTDRVDLIFSEAPVSRVADRKSIAVEMTLEEAVELHRQLDAAIDDLKAAIVKREESEVARG